MNFGYIMGFLFSLILAFGISQGITAAVVITYILMAVFFTLWLIIVLWGEKISETRIKTGLKPWMFISSLITASIFIYAAIVSGNFVFLYFYTAYIFFTWSFLIRFLWINKGKPDAVL